MQLKSISVEKAYTINLGNYENYKFGMTMTVDVDPDDDVDLVIRELYSALDYEADNEFKRVKPEFREHFE